MFIIINGSRKKKQSVPQRERTEAPALTLVGTLLIDMVANNSPYRKMTGDLYRVRVPQVPCRIKFKFSPREQTLNLGSHALKDKIARIMV